MNLIRVYFTTSIFLVMQTLTTMIFSIDLGFETMIRFIYTAQESLITDILDLELLFEVYRLADQVDVYRYHTNTSLVLT
jgi:hypothetical protein